MVSQQQKLETQIRQLEIDRAISEGTTFEAGEITGFSGRQAIRGLSEIGITSPSERTKLIQSFITRQEQFKLSELSSAQRELVLLKERRIAEFKGVSPQDITIQQERRAGIETRESILEQLTGEEKQQELTRGRELFGISDDPFITQRQIDTFEPRPGQRIPVTETIFVDPSSGFIGRATSKEERLIQESKLTVEPVPERTIIQRGLGGVVSGFTEANIRTREVFTEPIFKLAESKGLDIKKFSTIAGVTAPSFISPIGISPGVTQQRKVQEFQAGITEGILTDIREQPLKQVLLVGAGFAGGFALRAVGAGVSTVSKVGGFVFEKGVVAGGLTFGGIFAFEKGQEIFSLPTARQKGASLGVTLKDVGLVGFGFAKGEKAFTQAKGFVRTFGRKELPEELIIAPEFFEGQQFPTIKKGQTAGQLRKEFFDLQLPGETKGVGRGFTASSEAFAKDTIIRGELTSEVPGLFQAPRVSPRFLRVGGEEAKLLGLDFLTGGSPTIIRLTPASIELAPGISSGLKTPTGRFPKGFFEKIKGTGRSIIPFAKTEKESIVGALTPLTRTGKEFFVKFQGVRIPIDQFSVKPIDLGFSSTTLGEVVSGISSRRLVTSSIITPARLGVSSLVSSLGRTTRVSSSIFLPSSSSLSSLSRGLSKGASSFIQQFRPSRSTRAERDFFSLPSSISRPSRRGTVPFLPLIPRNIIGEDDLFEDPFTPLGRKSDTKRKKKKKKGKGKKPKFKIAPSLTGIAQFDFSGITGPLPTGTGPLGVLPGQVRFVPRRKKSKKKRKKN